MFYFSTISSGFKRNEYRMKVRNELDKIKSDIDALVEWDKLFTDEHNQDVIGEKEEYNKDYLELQKIVEKIING